MSKAKSNGDEVWRPVVGFEGWYEVSNLGRVKRIPGGRGAVAGKILGLRYDNRGYLHVALNKQGKITARKTHRLVAEAFLGPRPFGLQVNHIDGNKANAAAINLEYVTASRNCKHAFEIGLKTYETSGLSCNKKGELCGKSKLTELQVKEIRSAPRPWGYAKPLAKKYGVTINCIYHVVNGLNWKHVK